FVVREFSDDSADRIDFDDSFKSDDSAADDRKWSLRAPGQKRTRRGCSGDTESGRGATRMSQSHGVVRLRPRVLPPGMRGGRADRPPRGLGVSSMSNRKPSSPARGYQPVADALETRQLLSGVVGGTDIDGDTWVLHLIGPGAISVVKQNDSS